MIELTKDYSIIVSMDRNGLIGKQNKLPWRIQEDMDYFRSKTLKHTVIMGRSTWESIGKPLEQRTNIVLTRRAHYSPTGVIVCSDLAEVDQIVGKSENFIIGGANIYEQYLPFVSKVLITRVDAVYVGDTYFPEIDLSEWKQYYYEEVQTKSGVVISFNEYIRM